MNTDTQSVLEAGLEQVIFEVLGAKRALIYICNDKEQHEMRYKHPETTLYEALDFRGNMIPHGARVLVMPKDDVARQALAEEGKKELSVEGRTYVLGF